MPYYRKKYKKYRRNGKKKRFSTSYKTMAYKGYQMGKKAMKYLNTEHKHFDTQVQAIFTDAGVIATLNLIPQGDTDTTRDGDSIKMMSLTLRGACFNTVSSNIRIIIFHDKQDQVLIPADLLEAAYFASVNATNAPKNYDYRFRSKILFDRNFALSANGKNQYNFHKQIKLLIRTQFDAGTTNITTGALKVCYIGDQPVTFPAMNIVYRLTFVDN